MNITQHIDDFLRDGQYRFAELAVEMDQNRDNGDTYFNTLKFDLFELGMFLNVLYESRIQIKDATNWTARDWTDKELLACIQYFRDKHAMNQVPFESFFMFQNYWSTRLSETVVGSGTGLPSGNPGDFLLYNSSGIPVPVPFFDFVGAGYSSPYQYFN